MPHAGMTKPAAHANENVQTVWPFKKSVPKLPWTVSRFAADFLMRGFFDIQEADAWTAGVLSPSLVVLALPPKADGMPAPGKLTHPDRHAELKVQCGVRRCASVFRVTFAGTNNKGFSCLDNEMPRHKGHFRWRAISLCISLRPPRRQPAM